MPPLLKRQTGPPAPPPVLSSPPPSPETTTPLEPLAEPSTKGFLASLFGDTEPETQPPPRSSDIPADDPPTSPSTTRYNPPPLETYTPQPIEPDSATAWAAPSATGTSTPRPSATYREPVPTDDRTMREKYDIFKQNCVIDASWDDFAILVGLTAAILLFIFFKKLFQKARSKPSATATPPSSDK
ncbi:hypothetical protein NliqN6_5989 [Naganishia liquefaciens]|uniref:Uncharacterized protein n=1 Tax=Naganishia liquefaciens TaxID=104408 RepID=A0A8H3TYS1_9TREE|nr:hypothetical protein NliqN6_5989 [Naganishia liquefaciens]